MAKKSSPLKVPQKSNYGTGKRKSAIARVWLFDGDGTISVNGQEQIGYFKNDVLVSTITAPLEKAGILKKVSCVIRTKGGGLVGQADAAQLGVTRAILEMNPDFRKTLKEEGYVSRDDREKERKKYGRKRARKGFQFRKR